MDPLTMTLLAMIPGLIQTGVGAFQGVKGNQLGREEQPMMEIPDSIKQMLQASKNIAGQRTAPGSDISRDRIQSDVAAAMAHTANIQGGSGAALAGMGNLYGAEQQALQNVDMMDQQFYQQNQAQLLEALKTMGAFEDLQWIRNVKEPFDRTMESAAAMKQGAIQNIAGGVGSMVGGGLGAMKYNEMMKKISPPGGTNELLPGMRTQLPQIPFDDNLPWMQSLGMDSSGVGPVGGGVNQPPEPWQQWIQSLMPDMFKNMYPNNFVGPPSQQPYSLFQ
jgi:hypothetical protein